MGANGARPRCANSLESFIAPQTKFQFGVEGHSAGEEAAHRIRLGAGGSIHRDQAFVDQLAHEGSGAQRRLLLELRLPAGVEEVATELRRQPDESRRSDSRPAPRNR